MSIKIIGILGRKTMHNRELIEKASKYWYEICEVIDSGDNSFVLYNNGMSVKNGKYNIIITEDKENEKIVNISGGEITSPVASNIELDDNIRIATELHSELMVKLNNLQYNLKEIFKNQVMDIYDNIINSSDRSNEFSCYHIEGDVEWQDFVKEYSYYLLFLNQYNFDFFYYFKNNHRVTFNIKDRYIKVEPYYE